MSRITFFFFYTLGITLLLPALFSNLQLLFFAPFLVITFYNKNKLTCLWWALLCGMIIDLLSAQMRLGAYAFNYCATVMIVYSQKRHFFEDSISTFPIMTFLFSIVSTLIQVGMFYSFGHSISLSFEWVKQDLIWMPLLDAFYAALLFTLPYLCFPKNFKKQSLLFSSKRNT